MDASAAVAQSLPDSAITHVVNNVHEQPNLLQSKTFQELYGKFLLAQKKLLEKYRDFFYPKAVDILEREIAGTYIPEVKKDPAAPTPAPVNLQTVSMFANVAQQEAYSAQYERMQVEEHEKEERMARKAFRRAELENQT